MPSRIPESFGRRVAGLRAEQGLTQQDVAARLALSRNAVSHLETGLSHPSERTVVLLAGLFGLEPHELVAGTDYPQAKADRLPLVAPRFTLVGARLHRLDVELDLIARLADDEAERARDELVDELRALEREALDPSERAQLAAAVLYVGATSVRKRS